MTQKKITTASERSISLSFDIIAEALSSELKKEQAAFCKRNAIVKITHSLFRNESYECCPNCLKAHLLKKAEEMDSGKDISNILHSMVEHETGHYGYYLDDGELIKI